MSALTLSVQLTKIFNMLGTPPEGDKSYLLACAPHFTPWPRHPRQLEAKVRISHSCIINFTQAHPHSMVRLKCRTGRWHRLSMRASGGCG